MAVIAYHHHSRLHKSLGSSEWAWRVQERNALGDRRYNILQLLETWSALLEKLGGSE